MNCGPSRASPSSRSAPTPSRTARWQKCPRTTPRSEMAASIARTEAELGQPCRHFSYPYGDSGSAGPREFALAAELGLSTAVTTAKGMFSNRADTDPMGLARFSLNGHFQDERLPRRPSLRRPLRGAEPFDVHHAAARRPGRLGHFRLWVATLKAANAARCEHRPRGRPGRKAGTAP